MSGYLEPTLLVAGFFAVLAVLGWIADRKLDAPVDQPSRPDRRIPPDELALTGEDYRDCVADFFTEDFIRSTRRRFAVFSVTGADPDKKMAPARVESPGAMTTHGGNSNVQYR